MISKMSTESSPQKITSAAEPTVSCLIPLSSDTSNLKRAVDSILKQRFEDFELILICPSTYSDVENISVVLNIEDVRVKFVTLDSNNISEMLNVGIAASRGRYIAMMDDQNISTQNRFELQVSYLNTYEKCSVVGGVAEIVSEGGSSRFTSGSHYHTTDVRSFPPKVAGGLHQMLMFRREILMKIGGYRCFFQFAEDVDLYLRITREGSIEHPNEIVYKFVKIRDVDNLAEARLRVESSVMAEACAIYETLSGLDLTSRESTLAITLSVWSESLYTTYVQFRLLKELSSITSYNWHENIRTIWQLALRLEKGSIFSKRHWRLRFVMACYAATYFLEKKGYLNNWESFATSFGRYYSSDFKRIS